MVASTTRCYGVPLRPSARNGSNKQVRGTQGAIGEMLEGWGQPRKRMEKEEWEALWELEFCFKETGKRWELFGVIDVQCHAKAWGRKSCLFLPIIGKQIFKRNKKTKQKLPPGQHVVLLTNVLCSWSRGRPSHYKHSFWTDTMSVQVSFTMASSVCL